MPIRSCPSKPPSSSAGSCSMSYHTVYTASVTTDSSPTLNAPRTSSRHENFSASNPLKMGTTTTMLTTQHRPTGYCARLAAQRCALSKSSSQVTRRPLHFTEALIRHHVHACLLNTVYAEQPLILNRQGQCVALARAKTISSHKFNPSSSCAEPKPVLPDSFCSSSTVNLTTTHHHSVLKSP